MSINQLKKDDPIKYLQNFKYMQVVTFKRNGTGVPTAVWFAIVNKNIYFHTLSYRWKVKRLKRNSKIEIRPCTMMNKIIGKGFSGKAEKISSRDKELIQLIEKDFRKKFPIKQRLFRFNDRLRRRSYEYYKLHSFNPISKEI